MGNAVVQPGNAEPLYSIDAASVNIPTTYTAGSVIRNIVGPARRNNFAALNYATSAIAISLNGGVDHFVVPAGVGGVPSVTLIENVVMGTITKVRSLSGAAITTGVVYLMVW